MAESEIFYEHTIDDLLYGFIVRQRTQGTIHKSIVYLKHILNLE